MSRRETQGNETSPQALLLALDWGTSALRAYLLGPDGLALEERRRPWGIMRLPEGGYLEALNGIAGDWLAATPGLGVIACGMVGSAQGLREVPYVPCPAGRDQLASALAVVEVGTAWRLHVVPGVMVGGDRPDVMRGEETQVMGVLERSSQSAGVRLVMPGTHSKWVQVRGERIVDFQTYMTGELYAVLSEHSILGRPARAALIKEEASAPEAFERGVAAVRSRPATGASEMLFSTRALVLQGQLEAKDSLEYLSGLLVGEELRCALSGSTGSTTIALAGDDSLCARYGRAMAVFGLDAPPVFEDSAARGLWRIARQAGLVRVES